MGLVSSCPIGKTYYARGNRDGAEPFALGDVETTIPSDITFNPDGSVSFDPASAIRRMYYLDPRIGGSNWDLNNLETFEIDFLFPLLTGFVLTEFAISDNTASIGSRDKSIKFEIGATSSTADFPTNDAVSVNAVFDFTQIGFLSGVVSMRQFDYTTTVRIPSTPVTYTNNSFSLLVHPSYGPVHTGKIRAIGSGFDDNCKDADVTWQNGYNGPSVDFFTDPTRAQNQLEATFEVTSEFIQQYQDSSTEGDEVIGTT